MLKKIESVSVSSIVCLCVIFLFGFCLSGRVYADDLLELKEQLNVMQKQMQEQMEFNKRQAKQIDALQKQLEKKSIEDGQTTQIMQPAEFEKVEEKSVKLSGVLNFNYARKDFDSKDKDKGGYLNTNYLRLGIDADSNDILLSLQYRWYSYMNTIHHGWIGHNLSDNFQLQFGITRVPFGILPYASHGYWEGLPYYLGLEDDYDLGLKMLFEQGPHDFRLAFFKNEEWGFSSSLNRYSYDVVRDSTNFPDQTNEEINQFNARYAYCMDHGQKASTELGVSGQWGQLYNRTNESCGDHWAVGLHLNGNYGPVNLMLESIQYEYNPNNPIGVNDKTILIGAFNDAFLAASKGQIYVANLSYSVPVQWGPVTELLFYDDYSILVKEKGFYNSQINTLGCQVSVKPVYIWLDFIMANNAMYLGGPTDSFATGRDEDWSTMFNISIGFYF